LLHEKMAKGEISRSPKMEGKKEDMRRRGYLLL
jgi:hypothetical protein